MLKNVAGQEFHVIAFNSSGRVSGVESTITCELRKDTGTRVALTDVNPTEIGTTGEYVFTLTQAETNGHALSFTPVCTTSGVNVLGNPSNVIYTSRSAEIMAHLENLKGPGDQSISILVNDADGNAIPNCNCWVATDIDGNNVITDSWKTDNNGLVEFLLDAGTYYLFRQKNGVTFTNPQEITVV